MQDVANVLTPGKCPRHLHGAGGRAAAGAAAARRSEAHAAELALAQRETVRLANFCVFSLCL